MVDFRLTDDNDPDIKRTSKTLQAAFNTLYIYTSIFGLIINTNKCK